MVFHTEERDDGLLGWISRSLSGQSEISEILSSGHCCFCLCKNLNPLGHAYRQEPIFNHGHHLKLWEKACGSRQKKVHNQTLSRPPSFSQQWFSLSVAGLDPDQHFYKPLAKSSWFCLSLFWACSLFLAPRATCSNEFHTSICLWTKNYVSFRSAAWFTWY